MTARSDAFIPAALDLHQHHPILSAYSRLPCIDSTGRERERGQLTSTFLTTVFHIFPLLNLLYTGNSPFAVRGTLYASAATEDDDASAFIGGGGVDAELEGREGDVNDRTRHRDWRDTERIGSAMLV